MVAKFPFSVSLMIHGYVDSGSLALKRTSSNLYQWHSTWQSRPIYLRLRAMRSFILLYKDEGSSIKRVQVSLAGGGNAAPSLTRILHRMSTHTAGISGMT